jgi:hypothetical protein
MSQAGQYILGSGLVIETLTGDSGGAVSPNGAGNISIVGGDHLTTVGTPASSLITIDLDADIADTYTTDLGNAIPALGILNVLGGSNINTAGATDTVTINLDDTVSISGSMTAGTGYTATTGNVDILAGNLNVGSATPANPYNIAIEDTISGLIGESIQNLSTNVSAGVNLQLIVEPAAADAFVIYSVNGAQTWSQGVDNSDSDKFKITTGSSPSAGTVAISIDSAGMVTMANDATISTLTLTNALTVANGGTGATTLTDHGVVLGSGTGAVSVTAVGTDGQVLIGATGADPAFATITSTGSTITFTPGANTLNMEVDAAASGAVVTLTGDSGGAISPDGSGDIGINGGTNITTAGAANAITVNLDAAISLATSVTSPLYTVSSGDLVLNMTDDIGTNSVSFTNNSDAEVAYVDSLGAASFTNLDVDNININGNTIISTDTNGDITLTPDGTGVVNLSYLTQYTLPIAGASGAVDDLADGLGAAGEVLTSNGAGAEPTWQAAAAGGGLTWNVATGSTQACAVNNGYFANYNGTLAFTLPTTAAVGDTIEVCQMYAGQGWTIAVNSGETIYMGNINTTITTGTLASNGDGDWVELVCRVANTDWQANIKAGQIDAT